MRTIKRILIGILAVTLAFIVLLVGSVAVDFAVLPAGRSLSQVDPNGTLLMSLTTFTGDEAAWQPVQTRLTNAAAAFVEGERQKLAVLALRSSFAALPAGRIALLPLPTAGPGANFAANRQRAQGSYPVAAIEAVGNPRFGGGLHFLFTAAHQPVFVVKQHGVNHLILQEGADILNDAHAATPDQQLTAHLAGKGAVVADRTQHAYFVTGLELTHEQAVQSVRLCYALTYASCQGLTLPGIVRLDTRSDHFTMKHLYVGLSRGTAADLVEVV